ncbi:MAG: tetratricopeptide repeat protein, partial [Vicinamibacterales bacterium]
MLPRRYRLVFVVPVLALLVVAGCRRSKGSIAKGDEFFQKKDYRAASLEYRGVLAADNRNGVAHQKLARAYRELGAMEQAWGEFVRAADLLPASADAQLDAAEALLVTGQFEDARSRAEKTLAQDAKNVRAHTIRGLATAGLKDTDRAVDEIQKALELDPSRASTYANLGALQLARGRSEEAEAALKQAAMLAPDQTAPKLALANFYWLSNRRDQAETVLKEALLVKPNDPAVNRSLAILYIVSGRSAEAEGPLKVYGANGGPEAELALADYYIEHQRPQDATPLLARLSAVKEAHAAAEARLAGIDYIQDRRSDAYTRLDGVLKSDPKNNQVLVLKARWLLSEKRNDEALAVAQAAVAADPKAVNAQYLLGTVRQARNEPTEAIAAYNEVLTLNPRAAPAQLELARINSAVGKSATAVQLASTLVNTDPKNLDARLALVQALRRQGDVQRAARELTSLLASAPKSDQVQTEAGEVAYAQRDLKTAAEHFDRALAIAPDSYEATAGRINVSVAQKNTADAVKRAEARLATHPKDPATLALAGRTYAIAGDLAKSEALLQQSIAADASYMPAYYYLGQIYVRQKRLGDARQRYEEMAKKQPDNVSAHTMVAMLLQAENKPVEAKARYEKILQIDPRATMAANNLAYMNAEAGTDLDMALQLARTAVSTAPEEPDVNDTLGWVYYKRDMANLAIAPL